MKHEAMLARCVGWASHGPDSVQHAWPVSSTASSLNALQHALVPRRQAAGAPRQGTRAGCLFERDALRRRCCRWSYATFLSKNCSSSVEPCSAVVEASRSTVCVTASK